MEVLREPGHDIASLEVPRGDKITKGYSGASVWKENVEGKSSREDTRSARREGRPSLVKSSAKHSQKSLFSLTNCCVLDQVA